MVESRIKWRRCSFLRNRTFCVKINGTVYRGTIYDTLILYDGDTLIYNDVQYKDGYKITLQVDPIQTTG